MKTINPIKRYKIKKKITIINKMIAYLEHPHIFKGLCGTYYIVTNIYNKVSFASFIGEYIKLVEQFNGNADSINLFWWNQFDKENRIAFLKEIKRQLESKL